VSTNFSYDAVWNQSLAKLQAEGNYRHFIQLERIPGKFPVARWTDKHGQPRDVTVWCSNDYLGMGQHPDVLAAVAEALHGGAGAGGTRNISGNAKAHVELERELASLHGKPAALTFTSGWISNLAALGTLGRVLPNCIILSDAGNHNSMIEGIRRSGAEKSIFRHNDIAHLDELLRAIPINRPKIIAFESVYSMDGDIAPIRDIAGPAALVDVVRSFAESFIFTTSLPPHVSAGATAAIRHLRAHPELREQHRQVVQYLKDSLSLAGLPVLQTPTHIVPVLIRDANRARAISQMLLEQNAIYAQPINYPTVPRGLERLRLTPTPFHTKAHVDALVAGLASALRILGASTTIAA
jgi:5-aminolevulinate synthase